MTRPAKKNLELLRDVPLKVTVELGRARLPIHELLRLAPGSLVELDALAGEPVWVKVNGKLVARGEVVVVNERMGVRVTEIVDGGTPRSDDDAVDEAG